MDIVDFRIIHFENIFIPNLKRSLNVSRIRHKLKELGKYLVLDPEVMIHPVVSVSALTRFIRCIYFWNLQFLNNLIIIKAKDPLPQAYMTLSDFGCPGWSLWYYCSQECWDYLVYQSFDFEHTWWRWIQRRVVCAKFDVYVFIDTSD